MKITITKRQVYMYFLVMTLASNTIYTGIAFITSLVGFSYLAKTLTVIVVLFPVVIMCLSDSSALKDVIPFIILCLTVFLFFFVTITFHPEYSEYYFERGYLNVYNAIFDPYSGAILLFLAFSLVKRPEDVLKCLYYSAWLLLPYIIYASLHAEGEWTAVDMYGNTIKRSYGLNYGYKAIYVTIVFLYYYFKRRNPIDLTVSILSYYFALSGGSRGANLCLIVFLVLFFWNWIRKKKWFIKLFILVLFVGTYLISAFYWDLISTWLLHELRQLNIRSRTIEMILSNTITSDSSRFRIYEMTWQAITKMGYFGYGAYGSRPIIGPYFYWGYPHNIALEFLLEFGWVSGILFLGLIIKNCVTCYQTGDQAIVDIVCILVAMNAKLFVSDSFWQYTFFWGLLGFLWSGHEATGMGKLVIRRHSIKRSAYSR